MFKRLSKPYALVLIIPTVLIAACGDHFSTQEAYNTCEDIQTQTSSEAAFADCVDCYERCGAECERQNVEPPDEYYCPEDLDQ
jgi:hypothetical protein